MYANFLRFCPSPECVIQLLTSTLNSTEPIPEVAPLNVEDSPILVEQCIALQFSHSGELFLCKSRDIWRHTPYSNALEPYTGASGAYTPGGTLKTRWCGEELVDFLVDRDSSLLVVDAGDCRIFRIAGDSVHLFAGIKGATTEKLGATLTESSFLGTMKRLVRFGEDLFLLTTQKLYKLSSEGVASVALDFSEPTLIPIDEMASIPSVGLLLGFAETVRHRRMLFSPTDGSSTNLNWPSLLDERKMVDAAVICDTDPKNPILLIAFEHHLIRLDLFGSETTATFPQQESKPKILRLAYDRYNHSAAYVLKATFSKPTVFLSRLPKLSIRNKINLSALLTSPLEHTPATTPIIHQQSNTELEIHDFIVKVRDMTPAMLNALETSDLPISIINSVIQNLYDGTQQGLNLCQELKLPQSFANDCILMDALKKCAKAIHLMHLCEIDATMVEHLFREGIPDNVDIQFDLLLFVWVNCEQDDILLRLVVEPMRSSPFVLVEKAAELFKFASADPARWVGLIRMHQDRAPLYLTSGNPGTCEDPIARGLRRHFPVRWSPSGMPPADRSPSSWCFMIEGVDGYVESHDWILLPQWNFLELLATGEEGAKEYSSRIVTLPKDLPKRVLIAILAACHATMSPPLSTNESIYFLQYAERFRLAARSQSGELQILQPYRSLFSKGQTEIKTLCSRAERNRWMDCMIDLASKNSPFIDNLAISFIASHWEVFSIEYKSRLRELPKTWLAILVDRL